jgi:hypothetical protein
LRLTGRSQRCWAEASLSAPFSCRVLLAPQAFAGELSGLSHTCKRSGEDTGSSRSTSLVSMDALGLTRRRHAHTHTHTHTHTHRQTRCALALASPRQGRGMATVCCRHRLFTILSPRHGPCCASADTETQMPTNVRGRQRRGVQRRTLRGTWARQARKVSGIEKLGHSAVRNWILSAVLPTALSVDFYGCWIDPKKKTNLKKNGTTHQTSPHTQASARRLS